jgi:hypothetical protein
MTKYVVNSGGLRKNPELARKFFAEVVSGLGNQPKILICMFAQPREKWEEKFKENKKQNFFPKEVSPIFTLAEPTIFEAQLRETDAIYMYGGDDHLMMYWLRKFTLPELWNGKVVATNSASSDVLSTHFWPCDWREPMDGLAILPIKVIPHFNSDFGADDPRGPVNWELAKSELEKYGNTELPLYALPEGEFIIIEQ